MQTMQASSRKQCRHIVHPTAQRHAKFTFEAFAAQTSTAPPAWQTDVGGHAAHSTQPAASENEGSSCAHAVRNRPESHAQSATLVAPRGAELCAGQATRAVVAEAVRRTHDARGRARGDER